MQSKVDRSGSEQDLRARLEATEKELVNMQQELFFSIAVGIKLNLSMQGRSSNKNIISLYEQAVAAQVPKSEWNVWLHKQFEKG